MPCPMVKIAVAQHAWTGDGGNGDSRYLTFSAGARIEVVTIREAGGWWAGKLDGKFGWFPSSFCIIEDVAPPKPAAVPAVGAPLAHPLAATLDPLQDTSPLERQPSRTPVAAPSPAARTPNLMDDPLGVLGSSLSCSSTAATAGRIVRSVARHAGHPRRA